MASVRVVAGSSPSPRESWDRSCWESPSWWPSDGSSEAIAYQDDVLNLAIGMTGWILIVVGILSILLALAVGHLLAAVGSARAFRLIAALRKRRARQQDALALGAGGVGRARHAACRLPSAPSPASPGAGANARRAGRLAAMLTEGMSLPDALERSPGLLPPHVLPLVRVGCAVGGLGAGLAAGGRDAATPTNPPGCRCWANSATSACCRPSPWWLRLSRLGSLSGVRQNLPGLLRLRLPRPTQWAFACVGHCLLLWYSAGAGAAGPLAVRGRPLPGLASTGTCRGWAAWRAATIRP